MAEFDIANNKYRIYREYDQDDYVQLSEWLEAEYDRYTSMWEYIQNEYGTRRDILDGIEGRISDKAFETALSGILRDHDAKMERNLATNVSITNGILAGLFAIERMKAEEKENGE